MVLGAQDSGHLTWGGGSGEEESADVVGIEASLNKSGESGRELVGTACIEFIN
jgi:hypothetical protein